MLSSSSSYSQLHPQLHSQLLGYSDNHVVVLPDHNSVKVHLEALKAIQQLMGDARRAGFQLRVASGYRSFERQLLIWNSKCTGKRPVLDNDGKAMDLKTLSVIEKIYAILRWSALPGASRHHWGTDIDIYDAAVMPKNYQLQLHPDEYTGNGLFAPMMAWLAEYLVLESSPRFSRPYLDEDKGGVAPELWHLSYQPIASRYEQQLSLVLVGDFLSSLLPMGSESDTMIEEQATVLEHLPTIYQRYIQS
jgi:LAS superfamily LD-carboxypeptidase LdcB